MTQALEGITVLDLTRHAPGPYCTMILGDLGANIIRIDEPATQKGTPIEQTKSSAALQLTNEFASPNSPYNPLNRNKRSIRLNLKEPAGQRIFYQMAETADVVVEGFRPGVVERLGIDYGSLKKVNTKIIYCSITGYGQDGPYHDLPGHDINYVSHAGMISTISLLGNRPLVPGNIVGDMAAGGMQAVIGILTALVARAQTGKGQMVDIAMTDGVVSLLSLYIGGYFQHSELPKHRDLVSCGARPYFSIYETKDGKFISIACAEPRFYENLCRALDCEEFIPYQMDAEKEGEIRTYFEQQFLTNTRDEWFNILSAKDIPVSKVHTLDELAADPQLRHRNMILEIDHPLGGKINQPGIPVKLSETPGRIRNTGSLPGQDSKKILREIGYKEEDIRQLLEIQVVSGPDD